MKRTRERQEREAKQPATVPQVRDNFVPPTPAQADRNRLVAGLAETTRRQLDADTAEQERLRRNGEAIGLLLQLRDGKVHLEGLHPDDQKAAATEVVRRADASEAFARDPQVLLKIARNVAAEYYMRRVIRADLARHIQKLKRTFHAALVTEQQGRCWVINWLLNLDPTDEKTTTYQLGAFIVGDITRANFRERATQAEFKLASAPGMLDEAKRIMVADVVARSGRYRLTDREYDEMIGPWNQKGGRSVDSIPVTDATTVRARKNSNTKKRRDDK